jgi:CrcB protein
MSLITFLWVGFGGALGSMARYGIVTLCTQRLGTGYPFGTLCVNVLGSFAIGLLMGWFMRDGMVTRSAYHALLVIGFLGGFTTFSSFALDVWNLLTADKNPLLALSYAMFSVIASVAAVAGGFALIGKGLIR